MRRALALSLGFLVLASGVVVACSGDDPEPGFTPTGEAGAGGASGGAGGASGGQGGQGGQGQSGPGGASGQGAGGGSGQGGGAGQGGACDEDLNEPNDAAFQATKVDGGGDGKLSDCDEEETTPGFAVLDGPDDEDWFFFLGEDGACGLDDIQPHVKLVPNPDAPSFTAEVCIFVRATTPETDPAVCAEGTTPNSELNDQGYVGCCGTTEARATIGENFETDETDVRIRIAKAAGQPCGSYKITYANNSD